MGSKTQSRGSSPKTPTRRPKLMRAAATEPSLATSNASRKDLATLHCSSSRAATLLNRVASYSSPQHHDHSSGMSNVHGNGSVCSTPGGRSPDSASRERKEPLEITISQSGNYFSFPSFDDFQEYHHEGEDRLRDRGK